MMRFNAIFLILTCLFSVVEFLAPAPLLAKDRCQISVETILAGRGDKQIDAKLKRDIRELQSMFNYTSYRLMGREQLSLAVGQTGTVNLPGNRLLKITPHKIRGNRADISLQMLHKRRTEFQTQVQILNRGSLFVGGPRYLNGNLIFKISSAD
jgi:hypothetical protein